MLTSTCSLSCSQSHYHWLLITLASLQPFQSFFALKSPISLSISSLCVVPYSIFLRKLKSMISLFFHFNISSSPCPALVSTDTILLLFTCIFCHTSILVESVSSLPSPTHPYIPWALVFSPFTLFLASPHQKWPLPFISIAKLQSWAT